MKNLFAAMVKFQAECPAVIKDDERPHFRSKFSSLEALKNCTQPLLAKHGLAVMQFPIGDGTTAGCRTIVLHESGESLEQDFLVPIGAKVDAQKSCSAVSYARRFSYSGCLNLVSSEDSQADKDGQDLVTAEKPAAKPAKKGLVNTATAAKRAAKKKAAKSNGVITVEQQTQAKEAVLARGGAFKLAGKAAFDVVGKECVALMGCQDIFSLRAENFDEFLEIVGSWEPTPEEVVADAD